MKLLYRPQILKSIATFLLLEVVTQLAAPGLAYALTSGPTAPEATSFEPVDTTDMVDLTSGDFTYSIPLLEVPGPEGGYPLALSYHAGIQPNEDASWVGLGWSLNPGAINRNVNGLADDHENLTQTRRDYWAGGATSTTSVGVSVGIPGIPAGVSFGLSFSQDTYRGFGVGTEMGLRTGFAFGDEAEGASLGLNASISTDGYGNSNAGIGVGISALHSSGTKATLGMSASTSGGFGINAGVSNSALNISMDSRSSSPSLSVSGATAMVENNRAGTIQTEVSSFGVSIPFPGGSVYLKHSNVRYWSDETVDVIANGSLYSPQAYVSNSGGSSANFNNKAFDTYRLLDPVNSNIYENSDPNKLQGGSYSDYDNYVVSAQGLGGSMRPYRYQEALYSQNMVVNGIPQIQDYPLPWINKPAFFRFENDFSNQYRQTSTGSLTSGPYTYQNTSLDHVRYNFDTQPQRGEANGLGYDANNNRIAGSKSIEYYTNKQIIDGQAKNNGFINQQAKGFVRDYNSQIGGFSITNASGVTYHYALPVYSFNEYFYMQKVGDSGTRNTLFKPNKYAYTWYLTAVTGPDFVDRNSDGLANQGDWGYWTVFNHGKWVDNYKWRNPSEGFHRDTDASFESFSLGLKEIYYLNSIATRTHTAIFIKSFRADGKGTMDMGGFLRDRVSICPPTGGSCSTRYIYPSPQLKLDRIIILENKHLINNLEERSALYNSEELTYNNGGPTYSTTGKRVLGRNIIDAADYTATPDLLNKSVGSCIFNYNYSLSPNTSNSWDESGDAYTMSNAALLQGLPSYTSIQLSGKLTLNQMQTFGHGGNGALPPTKFGYEIPQNDKPRGSILIGEIINSQGYVLLGTNSPFGLGDLLEFNVDGRRICCALIKSEGGDNYLARYIGSTPPQGTYVASLTKNPPYAKESYDMWGMFKSDFDTDLASLTGYDETMARATSTVSAKNTDVWSLRTIQTPLGGIIKIKYESDDYRTVVIKRPQMIANFGYGKCTRVGFTGRNYSLVLGSRLSVPVSSIFFAGQKVLLSAVLGDFSELEPGWTVGDARALKDKLITIYQVSDNVAGQTNVIYFSDDTNSLDVSSNGIQLSVYMGHLTLNDQPSISFGGGIRTKEVSFITNTVAKSTNYSYQNNDLPSGVTSYEPGSYLPVKKQDIDYTNGTVPNGSIATKQYALDYYASLPKLLSLARILPAPGIMYEYVTVNETVKRSGEAELISPQKTIYQFEVLKPNMIDILTISSSSSSHYDAYFRSNFDVKTREVAIHDFSTRIGRLKRRTAYTTRAIVRPDGSEYDADAKLNETVNHYLHDDLNNSSLSDNISGYATKMNQFNNIGMIQETTGDSRMVNKSSNGGGYGYDKLVIMSGRKSYPVVMTGTTTTDYKTNISITTENKQFDFLSGEVTSMLSTDGYGNRMLSESTPAYRKYPALGPKMGTNGNRNMLTQTAGAATFKVDAQGTKQGLIGATAQTWSTGVAIIGTTPTTPEARGSQGIWRPQSTYSWMPINTTADGLTPLSGANAYTDFFTGGAIAPWKKTSEVTLYDIYSSALEATDINGKYVATKKGYDRSRVLVSGGPASYNEIAYTGLEDATTTGAQFSGGIDPVGPGFLAGDASIVTDAARTTGNVHTGIKSFKLNATKQGLSYSVPAGAAQLNKTYRASVWTNHSAAQLRCAVNGTVTKTAVVNTQKQANGWYLLELVIPPLTTSQQSLRVYCYNNSTTTPVHYDDFRFQPIDAQTIAYVYDAQTGQLTHTLDNNNLYIRYEYDAAGRLTKTFRETFKYQAKLVNEVNYQYGPSRPALDDVALAVTPPSTSRSVQVTVSLPSALSTNRTIQYSPQSGVAYATVNNPVFTVNYSSAGTYWLRVKVTDGEGKQRELVRKVAVP